MTKVLIKKLDSSVELPVYKTNGEINDKSSYKKIRSISGTTCV